MSIRSIAGRRRRRAPRPAAASRGEGEDGAVVDGVGVVVEQRGAASRASPRAPRSRRGPPSEKFGTASRRISAEAPAARSDEQLAVADDRSRRPAQRRPHDDAVEVDRDLDRPPIAAEAPKATWTVPRSFSSSSTLPVSSAFSFVPTPSSAMLGPSSLSAVSSSSERRALGPARVGQAALDGQRDRLVEEPDAGDRPVDDQRPVAVLVGRDEALAAGQVPERARRGQLARRRGSRSGPSRPSRRSLPFAQVIRASVPALRSVRDRVAAAAQPVHVGAHHPGEHLLGDARVASRSAPRLLVAALRAAVCESDWTVGARTTSALPSPPRPAAAARRRAGRARPSAPGQRRRRPPRLAAKPLAEAERRRVGDDEDLLALLDAKAVAHNRAHCSFEIAHRRGP